MLLYPTDFIGDFHAIPICMYQPVLLNGYNISAPRLLHPSIPSVRPPTTHTGMLVSLQKLYKMNGGGGG